VDFQFLRDALRGLIEIINNFLGTNFSADLASPVAVVVAVPILGLTMYAMIRKGRTTVKRWTDDKLALDDDGKVVVDHIKTDLKNLQGEIRKAAKENANSALSPILELLSTRINLTQELVDDDDAGDPASTTDLDRHGRMPRKQMVRLVRETILSNLWSGNYFDENIRRRHVFHASFPDRDGERIAIIVRTPFAMPPKDDELPYGLDVRHSTRTVMRIQWDPAKHDDIEIKYVKRGWENAILSWNLSHDYVPKITDVHSIDTGTANSA
jgi:hypothetical protein